MLVTKITFLIDFSSLTCNNRKLLFSLIGITKIIIGEVVTEICPFISRHILAKLAECYFHTYSFFFLKVKLVLYQSALKNNF